ncbi:MAG TPA: APC family permease, partial [Actinomycetota bacterium]|nr:APC family permease [Actinomycetota bacterium]
RLSAAALSLKLPIALVIASVVAVVVTSYRQTVRAYPQGGGSYIVARENLGRMPGLLAAAAILTDYVLTVTVSVTAGTIAVTSALPELADQKVLLALSFIAVLSLANLRGAKEAGTLFAIPTYGFVAMIYVMLVTGFVRCLDACPQAATANVHLEETSALTLFLILRAFSTGSAALTGIEAVADGVQAFRRPQGKNAANTLAIMGTMSITMFLGITALAQVLHVRTTEELSKHKSVLAQIGETIFGGDSAMFFALQAFTALILILAANTAYQDFPRLSAILARDRFMPSQFRNRGDRLVFSNGILVLSVAAGSLVWAFGAELTALIKLYVVGVFTAFTLSQWGMVRRWFSRKEGAWRRGAAINATGGTVTGVVLIVVIVTKFTEGAWIVLIAMPVIISGLLAVNRHYTRVQEQLRARNLSIDVEVRNTVVLLVPNLDLATQDAVAWLRAVRPERVIPLYLGSEPTERLAPAWNAMAPRLGDLEPLRVGRGGLARAVRDVVRRIEREPEDYVTIVVPETIARKSLWHVFRNRTTLLKARLLFERRVAVVDSPLLPEEHDRHRGHGGGAVLEPERTVCIVPVSAVHDATARALIFAKSLRPGRLEAVFFAGERAEADEIIADWRERGFDLPLTVAESPFRDITASVLAEVRRHTADGRTLVTVVLPEFVVKKWWHHLLHNQTALTLKRVLLFEPRTVVASVPSHVD